MVYRVYLVVVLTSFLACGVHTYCCAGESSCYFCTEDGAILSVAELGVGLSTVKGIEEGVVDALCHNLECDLLLESY